MTDTDWVTTDINTEIELESFTNPEQQKEQTQTQTQTLSNQTSIQKKGETPTTSRLFKEAQGRYRVSELLLEQPHSEFFTGKDVIEKRDNEEPSKPKTKKALIGTVLGVYFPSMQKILGILLFLRLPWVIGHAGVGLGLLIVIMSCSIALLTGLSLSAVSTNGVLPPGGAYIMISRALGPAFGGAFGLLYFLGTVLLASLHTLGAVEVFESITHYTFTSTYNKQIFSMIVLTILMLLVFVGIKYVSRFGALFLIIVLISVLSMYLGFFIGPNSRASSEYSAANSSKLKDNMKSSFKDATGSTSFPQLLSVYFPAVTGFLSGANYSGDLKDAQHSIPIGTLSAIITITLIYITCAIFFGSVTTRTVLETDKFMVRNIGWPISNIIEIGIILAAIGATLQALTVSPRILQALSKDHLLPFLKPFEKMHKEQEPRRALILTWIISMIFVQLGEMDNVAPIITILLLICYGGINLTCFNLSVLKAPSFRPRWKYFHWSTALIGFILSGVMMFLISWYTTLAVLVLIFAIYRYIEWKGVEKEWGDSISGLRFKQALNNLLQLDPREVHHKNWRPQILTLLKVDENGEPTHRELIQFIYQLKENRGLSIAGCVIQGKETQENIDKAESIKQTITQDINQKKVRAFSNVVISQSIESGISFLIQGSGLGALTPNTVVFGWPKNWKSDPIWSFEFVNILHLCHDLGKSVIVCKSLSRFPNNDTILSGTMDLWWFVHDGGLELILALLLKRNKVWQNCELRIFTVAEAHEDENELKSKIETLMYSLRIPAKVFVIKLEAEDFLPFMSHLNEDIQDRHELFDNIHVQKSGSLLMLDEIEQGMLHQSLSLQKLNIINNIGDEPFAEISQTNEIEPIDEKEKAKEIIDDPEIIDSHSHTLRIEAAKRLNLYMIKYSELSEMVLVNLPCPEFEQMPTDYMEYVDVLTNGLSRALLIRGTGREIITINY
ncbi:solute carrier family 12 [Anaeramoeba ignava]|uniref:Solute carrier family 12 n=1 Tax=Anaeramoeba ignava TaxID=1746090 RepID=A0A9Q0RDK4_ANAIG|nr:solute carrier family 12 [Anaeramoeba ignava]